MIAFLLHYRLIYLLRILSQLESKRSKDKVFVQFLHNRKLQEDENIVTKFNFLEDSKYFNSSFYCPISSRRIQ